MSVEELPPSDPELLRQRWEISHSPQLALQLAEEYRRRDRREDAIAVLEESLDLNPGHLAARMALGRFRFEVGRKQEACRDLESVVASDPTHLVANKLLVDIYLDLDRVQAARDRLDFYTLLNESDPEIEQLEQRWNATVAEEAAQGSDAPIPDAPISDIEGQDAPHDQIFPLPDPQVSAPDLVQAEVPVEASRRDEFQGAADDPFEGLWVDLDRRRRDGAGRWEDVMALSALSRPARAPSARPLPGEGATVPPGVAGANERSTVTMAELYLNQGHRDDAEGAFREVLEADPRNTAALLGLERSLEPIVAPVAHNTSEEAAEGSWLRAESLMVGAENSDLDPEARKIHLLKRYLERLRPVRD